MTIEINGFDSEPKPKSTGYFRFFILALTTLCLGFTFCNVVTINFTLNCMLPPNSTNVQMPYPTHSFDSAKKTAIQWAVSISSVGAVLPMSWGASRFGVRWIFGLSLMMSALSTALIPVAIEWGFVWLIVARVVQGIAYAMDFVVIGAVCVRWAPLTETAIFLAILSVFSGISNLFTNIVSGMICDSSWGWVWVHYLHGGITLFLFVLWILFYTDQPENSAFVSTGELSAIHEAKSAEHRKPTGKVPYWRIVRSPVVWSIWLNAFVDLFAIYFMVLFGPTYRSQALGFSATDTGTLGAIEAAFGVSSRVVWGFVSDKWLCVAEKWKLRIYNSISLTCIGLLFIGMRWAPREQPTILQCMMFGAALCAGMNAGGFYKCATLATRQYSEFVITCIQLMKSLVFFVAPALVAVVVKDDADFDQWCWAFTAIGVPLILVNILFCIYATDEPLPFTYSNSSTRLEPKYSENQGSLRSVME